MRGNPDNLRRAAARKSAAAKARAEHGLREMIRREQPITFRGLAQTAGVSLDFLYRTTEIRRRVEQLRAQQQSSPPAATARADSEAAEQRGAHPHRPAHRAQTPSPRRSARPEAGARGRARREPGAAAPTRPSRPRAGGLRPRGGAADRAPTPTRTPGCPTCCGCRSAAGWCSAPRGPGRARKRCTATRCRVEEWPAEPDIVERVPLRSCVRRGAAIDLVLDRGRENRSQLVFTTARGREVGVLAVPAHPQTGPPERAHPHRPRRRDRRAARSSSTPTSSTPTGSPASKSAP